MVLSTLPMVSIVWVLVPRTGVLVNCRARNISLRTVRVKLLRIRLMV